MPEADSWNFCAQSGCPGMSAVAPLVRANRTLALGAIAICNLYSIATNQAAIIALFRVINCCRLVMHKSLSGDGHVGVGAI